MSRPPRLVDRVASGQADPPPGAEPATPEDVEWLPEPAPVAGPRPRGRTSGPVVFAAVVLATFASVAFGIAPALYGSALLGGAAVWCGMLAGWIVFFEAVRHWWRRPNAARWRGAAAGARYTGRGVAWGAYQTWRGGTWAARSGYQAARRGRGGREWAPPGTGPWLMQVTSRSGQPISARSGDLNPPGERPGSPTTVLLVDDPDDLARRRAQASANPDLTVTVRLASLAQLAAWRPEPDDPPMPWAPPDDSPYKVGPPPPVAGPVAAGRPRPEDRRVGEPSGGYREPPTGPLPAMTIGKPARLRISSAHGDSTPGWDALISETGGWVADSDEEWLARSRAHVIGMGKYAQALLDAYENQVYETGVDPNALAGWILYAEAAADAAETMADGRRWFVQYLAEYRAAAQQGKHPPKDPHWVTGEGSAD